MKIQTPNHLSEILYKKIIRAREKAVIRLKNAFAEANKKDFQPFEIETKEITRKTIVSEKAFNSFISRHDVRRLKGKKTDDFDFVEGKTTVADILNFFFPHKPTRKKKKS